MQGSIRTHPAWARCPVACRSLASPVVIVRSSALGEDSHDASFAGQLESIAKVTDDQDLRARRRLQCLAHSQRVGAYERARGLALGGLAIVVQEQIASAVSGVVFSEDPGGEGGVLIEYRDGPGEALVSGRVNPGRIVVNDDGETRHLVAADCRLDQRSIDMAARQRSGCATARARVRRATGYRVDARRRRAVLVSPGATDHGSRDTPRRASRSVVQRERQRELPRADQSAALFGRVGWLLPLLPQSRTQRSACPTRLAAIEDPLRQIIGVHGARMYYNLTSIHTVLRAAPFGEPLAAAFNQFVGASGARPGRQSREMARSQADSLEIGRITASVTWQYTRLTRRVERFERTADQFADATQPALLPRLTATALRDRLRTFMDIRCHRWKDASLADAGSMVCYAALKAFLNRSFPGEDQEALHNTLLKALPGLVSGRPAIELWRLSRMIRSDARLTVLFESAEPADIIAAIRRVPEFQPFSQAFDRYLADWGFRCSGELMLTVPTFQEDPAALVPLLCAYARSDSESPESQLARQQHERLAETERIVAEIGPVRGLLLRLLLSWTQRAIQLRERARLKQALLYSRLRRLALAIGDHLVANGRLVGRDDVFMLTVHELDELLAGRAMFPNHVRDTAARRRHAHDAFADVRPPDTLRLAPGEYFSPATTTESLADTSADRLSGTSACGGIARGRAVVLTDLNDAWRLQAGDILVTRQTDPGWAPVFPLISGLVVERGGMLSHGAIIAREFGIPSVVGVDGATLRIPAGATICVDGDRGTVRVLSSPAVDPTAALQHEAI